MEIVAKATVSPGMCVFSGDIDGPYLDTGFVVNQETVGLFPRAYLHVPLVKQMGRAVGMVDGAELEEANEALIQLGTELDEAKAKIEKYAQLFGAIETLQKQGFTPKRKPGRPKKVTA